MILKRVICQIFLTTAITGLLMIWTECNSIQAKPLMINNNGITRITLKSLGIILEQQWEPLFGDTIFEEDSYYYSKVYKIGSSSDDSSSGTLYIVSTIFSGADKGENVGLPMRHYLFGYKDSLYYCGNSNKIQGLTGTFPVFQNIAEKMKKKIHPHSNIIIKELEKLQSIGQSEKKRVYLVPSEVMIGKPDTKNMEFVFDVDGIGPLYMINVENSFLANNPLDFKNPKLNTWINSCSDSGCFETNRFFLFRADGTFLIYDVKPPVLTDNLIPAENQKRIGFTEYTTSTLTTCEARSVAAVTPLSRKFIEKNPTEFYGIIPQNKDSFWVFEESAPVLKEAFTILKDAQNYWDENCTETKNFTDYESFVANIPLLVWKDPFNRSILYKIKELNPPACCEPVFYLYSEKDTTVSINLKYPETIRNSRPTIIDSGWTITIDKNKMIYGAVKENIPFVFWEGWVGVVPKPQTGFIVSRGELEKFMREKLCTTGLNNDEIIDFCNQWLKKCPEAPFYAVHFYDTEFAQRYCPVAISPQPQTIIRIYIDIEPCQKRRELRAQEINQVNERRGLTYVEWGAMVRSRNEF